MPQPAGFMSEMHACPMQTPGVPPIPHVGGPVIAPSAPTVLMGTNPATGISSMCTCVGPPDSIIMGAPTVLMGGKPVAQMGSTTSHGGSVVLGMPTILVG